MPIEYLQWAIVLLIGATVGVVCWMVWHNSKTRAQSDDEAGEADEDEISEARRDLLNPPPRNGNGQ
jgi:hypothetical protein